MNFHIDWRSIARTRPFLLWMRISRCGGASAEFRDAWRAFSITYISSCLLQSVWHMVVSSKTRGVARFALGKTECKHCTDHTLVHDGFLVISGFGKLFELFFWLISSKNEAWRNNHPKVPPTQPGIVKYKRTLFAPVGTGLCTSTWCDEKSPHATFKMFVASWCIVFKKNPQAVRYYFENEVDCMRPSRNIKRNVFVLWWLLARNAIEVVWYF